MAFTNTLVSTAGTAFTRVYDITAAADADTTDTIPHGLGVTPTEVTITPLIVKGITGQWLFTSADATNIVITKNNVGAGSGDANAQVRVIVRVPHSIIR